MAAEPKALGSGIGSRPKLFGSDTSCQIQANNKKKRTIVHFSCQERKMKEKTQTIDHWRQFNHDMSTHAALYGRELHTPHYMEESTAAHLMIWQMTRFGYRKVSHALL
jgi:IS5 family transposase